MEELVKLLDENLVYIDREIKNDTIYIRVESNRKLMRCPFCGEESDAVHSRYERSLRDLPIQGKKAILILENRKVFCNNPECNHKTFAERFDFFDKKAKKTKRLDEEIIRVSLNCSSVAEYPRKQPHPPKQQSETTLKEKRAQQTKQPVDEEQTYTNPY